MPNRLVRLRCPTSILQLTTIRFINIDESETRIRKAGPELREHWLMELKSEINTRFENYYKDYPPVVDPYVFVVLPAY